MTISLISAMSENHVIGNKGLLPWGHLPNDLANLYRITEGVPMIMGRKSYDTPDRVWSKTASNIVVTHQANIVLDAGFERAENIEQALQLVENQSFAEVFIIGGGEIFKQSIHLADYIYLTLVHATFEGDAYFPNIDPSVFQLIEKQDFQKDAQHGFDYSFLIYKKM